MGIVEKYAYKRACSLLLYWVAPLKMLLKCGYGVLLTVEYVMNAGSCQKKEGMHTPQPQQSRRLGLH